MSRIHYEVARLDELNGQSNGTRVYEIVQGSDESME